MTLSRRDLLVGAGVVGTIYGLRALPWDRVFPPALEFSPIADLPPFRRLAQAGQVSSPGSAVLVGLDAPRNDVTKAMVDRLRADPCPELFGDAGGGGAVPIAYFTEFRCPYCRALERDLQPLLAADPDGLRLVVHEWPIYGPESEFAARAFLAAARQGGQDEMRRRLMRSQVVADRAAIRRAAQDLGLDPDRLVADMSSPDADAALMRSRALAQLFGFIGTPGLVIGRTVLTGAVSPAVLERIIKEERALPAVC